MLPRANIPAMQMHPDEIGRAVDRLIPSRTAANAKSRQL
jgi:hypothetical protein